MIDLTVLKKSNFQRFRGRQLDFFQQSRTDMVVIDTESYLVDFVVLKPHFALKAVVVVLLQMLHCSNTKMKTTYFIRLMQKHS